MIVVKMGGAQGVNLAAICQDVAELIKSGESLVFVHGGSNETNELIEKMGMTTRFITTVTGITSRYTDRKTHRKNGDDYTIYHHSHGVYQPIYRSQNSRSFCHGYS